jgi:predicted  nucleic acid-binding Zn-ribbon protein
MHGRHGHRMHVHRLRPDRRMPNRQELLQALEERQKDLEQEIADIHDLIGRLRDEEDAPSSPSEPAPAS